MTFAANGIRLYAFEGLNGLWSAKRLGSDRPRKGSYYLSGAEPMAYLAPNDLTSVYEIVAPKWQYKQHTAWVPVTRSETATK